MKVYVAGKVTGLPEDEVLRKFDRSGATLKKDGHTVMSPAVLVLNRGFGHEDYMHVCLAMIDVCDAVYMQRDWRNSKGARMEREYATEQKKLIIYEDEPTRTTESMEDLEKIERRVRKLLALSKSPNESEALSALRKANGLMSEHRLTQADFAGYAKKSVKSTRRAVEWRIVLANAVERLYATCHFRDADTGSFVFYGEELDVFMSTEMFAYLVKAVDRMAKRNIRGNAKRRYRQSYRAGVASRLWDRMDELGRQCGWRDPAELAERRQEISNWVSGQVALSAAIPKQNAVRANMRAWKRGESDADGISLSRQTSGGGTRRIEGR